ncbi:MAG: glycosyltransferase family 2 protein [Lachnospiraceae bacterium]
MKVAVLVVTYNRKMLLKENIQAILRQSFVDFDYYICDNASTDGTKEVIGQEMKSDHRIKYYNTGKNLGGAGGFSFGLKKISEKNYDFCWIMDDDSIPEADALEKLLECSHKIGEKNFSFLASNVLWTDGTPCKMNQCSILKEKKIAEELEDMGMAPINRCSFVGCFVNMFYARTVGLPIKEFFIYGDDTEYTLRLSECAQAFFCKNSVIVHKMPANGRIGIAEAPIDRVERYQYEYRNRIYVYRYRSKLPWRKIVFIYLKESVKVLLRSKQKKGLRLRVIWSGFAAGLKFHPQIESMK